MAHSEQRDFFERVQSLFPQAFKNVRAIDCGSLDVNGSLEDLFSRKSKYIGVDIVPGPNVNLVCKVHELPIPSPLFDTVVSAEMLEHDEFWRDSLKRMYDVLRPGGLLVLSCAGPTRPEHGTRGTGNEWGTSPDYYRNLSQEDIVDALSAGYETFRYFEVSGRGTEDTYFWGVKAGMRLLLLAGDMRRPGWKTLDANPVCGPDILRTLPPLAVEAGSCEEIELCHGIGHFFKWEAEALLHEIYLALAPGGMLTLEQPNLMYAARVLVGLEDPIPGTVPGQCDMWPLYGDPNHKDQLHGIKWGWTPETLTDALVVAGFKREWVRGAEARYHLPVRDFRLEAVK